MHTFTFSPNRRTPRSHAARPLRSFDITPLQALPLDEEDTPSVCLPGFTIFWITGGLAWCQVDLQHFELTAGQIVCIRPGTFAQFTPGAEVQGYLISFADTFISAEELEFDIIYHRCLFSLFAGSGLISVQNDLQLEMNGIAERMKRESGNDYPYKDQILRRYLKIFLIYLSRHCEDAGDDSDTAAMPAMAARRGSELSREFMTLLDKNFKTVRSVAGYAQQLSVTPNHLNVVVKSCTGYTAGHHVKQRLTLEAKRLIVYSDLCMKEIAGELGFSDTAHFSKFFKNCSGINFSDFKKQNAGVIH